MDWLDSWTKVRRFPTTFLAAKRWATRADDLPGPSYTPPAILPYADSMYILKHGKKAWRAWKATRSH